MNTEDKLGTGKLVPGYNLFSISDILEACGIEISDITKGALITLEILFHCNFDKDEKCDHYPKFKWRREDTSVNSVSSGFNFRQTYYSLHDKQIVDRLLVKYHGIRIRFAILGQGAKYDTGAFSRTVGSGLALTGLATLLAEFLLKNCIQARKFYHEKRVEVVSEDQKDDGVHRINATVPIENIQ